MITLFGAPGSGKSEQGMLLARKYGWQWLSYRDLLLAMRNREVTYALEHGMFVDEDVMAQMMRNALASARSDAVLDGFPTDLRQVRWMIDNKQIQKIKGAIILRVPHGELWRRLMARKRVDDTRAAIERRNEAYDRAITGMTRALMQENIPVREVNGLGTPNDVLERIEEVLGEWGLVRRKQYQKISAERQVASARNTTQNGDNRGPNVTRLSASDVLEVLELLGN